MEIEDRSCGVPAAPGWGGPAWPDAAASASDRFAEKGVCGVTEQELVTRARAGDRQAFEQLVLDNQNRIYSLAVRLTGDREEAFDLAQEWIRDGIYRVEGFVTHHFPLDQYKDAMRLALANPPDVIKIVLDCQ